MTSCLKRSQDWLIIVSNTLEASRPLLKGLQRVLRPA